MAEWERSVTIVLPAPKRLRKQPPAHLLHKATWCGFVKIGGRFFYTGRWGTARAAERYELLIRSYIESGRTSVTTAA